jgi:hypothetical protein
MWRFNNPVETVDYYMLICRALFPVVFSSETYQHLLPKINK